MDFENKVLFGNCLDVLRDIPSDTFDSCVTDVPYGLGNKEPSPKEILAYLQGADLVTGDFMGKKWQIPSVPIWNEIYRVLKPGAHVLCFGGTRTWDLISMGARMAGFQRRDTIADMHPGLIWNQGQGMPKSHNVSKDLAGTDLAKDFEGGGTGMKPTWEPILVLRKPFKGTLASNLIQYGTGALNIDGCRIKHANQEDFEKHKAGVDAIKARGGSMANSWKNTSDLSGANDVKIEGRWPPNMTLTHGPGCKRVGTKTVKGDPRGNPGGKRPSGFGDVGADKGDPRPNAQVYGDETLDIYECESGCPVAELERQGGPRPSDGGISKYYPQFEYMSELEPPFRYVPKVSKKEATLNGRLVNEHVSKKPLACMRWLVRLVTPRGGLVLDPYCGSGSTLHVAAEEGARWTGIEYEKASFETATQRMEIVMGDLSSKTLFTSILDVI